MFKERESRETKVEGYILAKVKFKFGFPQVVSTYATVDGKAYDDWQCDGGHYHNEGWIDYDEKVIKAKYPDEYKIIYPDGTTKYGESEIIEIVEIYNDWLEEREV